MDQIFAAAPLRYLGPTESELSEADSYLVWALDPTTHEAVPVHQSASAYVLAAGKLPVALNRIKDLAAENDALALYGQLQLFDSFRRASQSAQDIFGSNALIEFFGGIVASFPEVLIRDHIDKEHDLELFFDLDNALREFGRIELLAYTARTHAENPADRYTKIRQFLKIENKFDRMQGYIPMLRRIASAILDPLTDESYKELGFALRNATVAADAMIKVQESAALHARNRAYSQLPPSNTEQQLWDTFFDALKDGSPKLEPDLPQMLASYAELDPDQARELLNAMSTTVGCQAPITSLEDRNELRRRPILKLADGRMIWGRPVDFCHVALDWAYEVARDRPSLLKQLDSQRQKSVEELAAEALAGVFGGSRVQTRVTYPAEGQPDIDILVTLPDALLIIELKGGRVTDPARRGADGRVKKKLAEFIEIATFQNCRAWEHVKSQKGGFRDRFGRRMDSLCGTIAISVVVTLDRVDPFYTQYLEVESNGSTDLPQVLVSLADLLTRISAQAVRRNSSGGMSW